MRLSDLTPSDCASALQTEGLIVRVGPFLFRIRSRIRQIIEGVTRLYAGHEVFFEPPPGRLVDFHVSVNSMHGLRGWLSRSVFCLDTESRWQWFSTKEAFAYLEWGMNWCVWHYAHQYLILHAGVLEKNGQAVLLSANSGGGKSTLTAAMMHNHWRLLSDELGLLCLQREEVMPLPRPISLKETAIELLTKMMGNPVFGPRSVHAQKGVLVHLLPDSASVMREDEPADPRWVIFVNYQPGAETVWEPVPPHQTFLKLAVNTFNYTVLGSVGFHRLTRLVDHLHGAYQLTYSHLPEVLQRLDELVSGVAGQPEQTTPAEILV